MYMYAVAIMHFMTYSLIRTMLLTYPNTFKIKVVHKCSDNESFDMHTNINVTTRSQMHKTVRQYVVIFK